MIPSMTAHDAKVIVAYQVGMLPSRLTSIHSTMRSTYLLSTMTKSVDHSGETDRAQDDDHAREGRGQAADRDR